jgi:hypothetical protein
MIAPQIRNVESPHVVDQVRALPLSLCRLHKERQHVLCHIRNEAIDLVFAGQPAGRRGVPPRGSYRDAIGLVTNAALRDQSVKMTNTIGRNRLNSINTVLRGLGAVGVAVGSGRLAAGRRYIARSSASNGGGSKSL